MFKRVTVAVALIGFVAFLFTGCQRGAIIEGGAEEAKGSGGRQGEGADRGQSPDQEISRH